jgi:hypothetical protein
VLVVAAGVYSLSVLYLSPKTALKYHASRYKNGLVDGPVIGPWCGSSWHFNQALKNPRFEDFKMLFCKRNRFSYLGHGRTLGELRGDDMATHLSEPGV